MPEEKNNNSQNESQKVSNGYSVQNDKGYVNEAYDSQWITERGGTNNEPGDTPSERPHSNK